MGRQEPDYAYWHEWRLSPERSFKRDTSGMIECVRPATNNRSPIKADAHSWSNQSMETESI